MTKTSETGATEDATRIVIRSDMDRQFAKQCLDSAQNASIVSITPPRASDELTSRMHCAIRCISKQLLWAGEKLSEEDWKRLLVAALYGQRVMPSPSGTGFVVLDRSTSRMSGSQKFDLTEWVYSFGAERGVVFDDDSYQGAAR